MILHTGHPFYNEAKLAFLIYIGIGEGADKIYCFLEPYLLQGEEIADNYKVEDILREGLSASDQLKLEDMIKKGTDFANKVFHLLLQ